MLSDGLFRDCVQSAEVVGRQCLGSRAPSELLRLNSFLVSRIYRHVCQNSSCFTARGASLLCETHLKRRWEIAWAACTRPGHHNLARAKSHTKQGILNLVKKCWLHVFGCPARRVKPNLLGSFLGSGSQGLSPSNTLHIAMSLELRTSVAEFIRPPKVYTFSCMGDYSTSTRLF